MDRPPFPSPLPRVNLPFPHPRVGTTFPFTFPHHTFVVVITPVVNYPLTPPHTPFPLPLDSHVGSTLVVGLLQLLYPTPHTFLPRVDGTPCPSHRVVNPHNLVPSNCPTVATPAHTPAQTGALFVPALVITGGTFPCPLLLIAPDSPFPHLPGLPFDWFFLTFLPDVHLYALPLPRVAPLPTTPHLYLAPFPSPVPRYAPLIDCVVVTVI